MLSPTINRGFVQFGGLTIDPEILLVIAGLIQNLIQHACHILEDRSLHTSRYVKDPKNWRKASGRAKLEQNIVSDAPYLEQVSLAINPPQTGE